MQPTSLTRRLCLASVASAALFAAPTAATAQTFPSIPFLGEAKPWIDISTVLYSYFQDRRGDQTIYLEQWLHADIGLDFGTKGDGWSGGINLSGGVNNWFKDHLYSTNHGGEGLFLADAYGGLREIWVGYDNFYFASGWQRVFYGDNRLNPSTGISEWLSARAISQPMEELGQATPRNRDQSPFGEAFGSGVYDDTQPLSDALTSYTNHDDFDPYTYFTFGSDAGDLAVSAMVDDSLQSFQFDADLRTGDDLRQHLTLALFLGKREDGLDVTDWGLDYNLVFKVSETMTLSGGIKYIHGDTPDTAATNEKNALTLNGAMGLKLSEADYLSFGGAIKDYTRLDSGNSFAIDPSERQEVSGFVSYTTALQENMYAYAQLDLATRIRDGEYDSDDLSAQLSGGVTIRF